MEGKKSYKKEIWDLRTEKDAFILKGTYTATEKDTKFIIMTF